MRPPFKLINENDFCSRSLLSLSYVTEDMFNTRSYRVAEHGRFKLSVSIDLMPLMSNLQEHVQTSATYDKSNELIDTIRVVLNRPSKQEQLNFLNTAIETLGLDFKKLTPSYAIFDRDNMYVPPGPVVLKDLRGACSVGTVLVDKPISKSELQALCEDNCHKLGVYEDRGHFLGGALENKLVTPLVEDIEAEYRAWAIPGKQQFSYRRDRREIQPGLTVPCLAEHTGHPYSLDGSEIPSHIWDQVVKLVGHLDIWGYAIDLYKTKSGEWGIFEYSPEYGVERIKKVHINKLLQLAISGWVNRVAPHYDAQMQNVCMGSKLRAWRHRAGWSLRTTASKLHMSESLYSKIEMCGVVIADDVINRICELFNVTYTDIVTVPKFMSPLKELTDGLTEEERSVFEHYVHRQFHVGLKEVTLAKPEPKFDRIEPTLRRILGV